MALDCGLPIEIEISEIIPAEYNPRIIGDDQFNKLCESINRWGVVIPVIINGANKTIVAGHQRTKACAKCGKSTIAAIITKDISKGDEIRFNQLHNGSFGSQASAHIATYGNGYSLISPDKFSGFECSAAMVKEACGLMSKYGNVFSAVAVGDKIVYGAEYIRAAQLLHAPKCLVYATQDNVLITDDLHSEYGKYSYEHLEKHTYVQGLAQLYRSPIAKAGRKPYSSTLYNRFVIPWVKPGNRVLDFGCGKGAYVSHLNRLGAQAIGIEFYPNNGSDIMIGKAKKMVNDFMKDYSANGAYDSVVCDSVLNSVDSPMAEISVIRTISALTKNRIFISGRPLDAALGHMNSRRASAVSKRFVEFIDDDGFTATYRKGQWYYQHYQTKKQVEELLEGNGLRIITLDWRKNGDSWQAECQKERQLPIEQYRKAIEFEFSLPLPNGKKYDFYDNVWAAISKYLDA